MIRLARAGKWCEGWTLPASIEEGLNKCPNASEPRPRVDLVRKFRRDWRYMGLLGDWLLIKLGGSDVIEVMLVI